jgi:hypothetical protein
MINKKMIEEKMSALEICAITGDIQRGDERAILRIEKEIETRLPDGYKSFLSMYGVPTNFSKTVKFKPKEKSPWDTEEGYQEIVTFYGLDESENGLITMFDRYAGRIPSSLFVIAEAPGGNQICIAATGEDKGKLFLWDHENERDLDKNPNDFGNVHLIAYPFEEFVESLFAEDEEPIEGLDDKIEDAWFSDDF